MVMMRMRVDRTMTLCGTEEMQKDSCWRTTISPPPPPPPTTTTTRVAKGRDDADNLFENIENSVEETRSAVHEIEDASREIHGSLRELCDKGLRARSRDSK